MKIKLLTAFVFVVFYACSPKISQTEVPKTKEAILSTELVQGKVLYENNCANCHNLFNPKSFSAEQWRPIMLKMQQEAKISDEEREKIYAYLTK